MPERQQQQKQKSRIKDFTNKFNKLKKCKEIGGSGEVWNQRKIYNY